MMRGGKRAACGLAVAAVVAGSAYGIEASSAAGAGCQKFVQAASPARDGYSEAQVERAFAAQGFQLSWSFQSYPAPSREATRCHLMLADQLLYTGGPTGPCLYVYLFPERLGNVPAGARRSMCGDASGRPATGLRRGTLVSGSILLEYTLGPTGLVRINRALARLR